MISTTTPPDLCEATLPASGKPCPRPARTGSDWCLMHTPKKKAKGNRATYDPNFEDPL
jgi:hypothetical protein